MNGVNIIIGYAVLNMKNNITKSRLDSRQTIHLNDQENYDQHVTENESFAFTTLMTDCLEKHKTFIKRLHDLSLTCHAWHKGCKTYYALISNKKAKSKCLA